MRNFRIVLAVTVLVALYPDGVTAQGTDTESGVNAWWISPECVEFHGILPAPPYIDVSAKASCVHQPVQEAKGAQQRARAYNRWWQIGLSTASQVMLGVQWARDVYDSWGETFDLLKAAVAGADAARPERTAYLIERASERLQIRSDQQTAMLQQHQVREIDDRYEMINLAVTNALKAVDLMENNAAGLSERAMSMASRFGDVEFSRMLIGGEETRVAGNDGLPRPRGSRAEVNRVYNDIFSSQPATVSGRPLASSAGPSRTAGALTDDQIRCPVESFDEDDPEVVFQRAQIMAAGAQMGSQGIRAEARADMEQIRSLAQLEKAREREAAYAMALRAILNF